MDLLQSDHPTLRDIDVQPVQEGFQPPEGYTADEFVRLTLPDGQVINSPRILNAQGFGELLVAIASVMRGSSSDPSMN